MTNGPRNPTIVIVDGNLDSMESVRAILSNSYTDVSTLRPFEESADFQTHTALIASADLLICDLYISKSLDIRERPRASIFLSRFQKSDVLFKQMDHGSFYCLPKPVCPEVLLPIARMVISGLPKIGSPELPLFPTVIGNHGAVGHALTFQPVVPSAGQSLF